MGSHSTWSKQLFQISIFLGEGAAFAQNGNPSSLLSYKKRDVPPSIQSPSNWEVWSPSASTFSESRHYRPSVFLLYLYPFPFFIVFSISTSLQEPNYCLCFGNPSCTPLSPPATASPHPSLSQTKCSSYLLFHTIHSLLELRGAGFWLHPATVHGSTFSFIISICKKRHFTFLHLSEFLSGTADAFPFLPLASRTPHSSSWYPCLLFLRPLYQLLRLHLALKCCHFSRLVLNSTCFTVVEIPNELTKYVKAQDSPWHRVKC